MLPVVRIFEQCVELSFYLSNIPDFEVLQGFYDIHNPYVLHESQVLFSSIS